MTRSRSDSGMSLIEVALALCMLALIAVFLLGSITVITRGQMMRADKRAQANALAIKYLEAQRSRSKEESLRNLPLETTVPLVSPPPTPFVVTVDLYSGSVGSGVFVAGSIPKDDSGNPLGNAAVKVVVHVTWPENPAGIQREAILVPR